MVELTEEDREGVVQFISGMMPHAREGATYVVRQRYGGRWRLSELGWEPEEEFLLRQRCVREIMARMTPVGEERALSDGAREQRIYDASPSYADLERELGGMFVVTTYPDGTKSAKFRDTSLDGRWKKKLDAMYDEARRLELEKSEDLSTRFGWDDVGTAYHPHLVPEQHADRTGRKLAETRA